MEEIKHTMISVNGLNMHVAEKGQGPIVLFLHGFPELWYSWRHQINFMAAHGYRAVAPDLRGYGDTTGAPIEDASKFSTLHVVGDLVVLVDAIAAEEEKVFVVGHDWGAFIAWHLCLFRADKVKALVNMSLEFIPWSPKGDYVEQMRGIYGDNHYMYRFQVPGEIEAVLEPIGIRNLMKIFLTYRNPGPLFFPKGQSLINPDAPPTMVLPSWITEEDIDYYVSKFDKTGFTGGINYYRALHSTWEHTAVWHKGKVMVPTKFLVGDLDLTYNVPGIKEYIHDGGMQKDVPLLQEVVVLEDTAHFINQERANEVNTHILDFFKKF